MNRLAATILAGGKGTRMDIFCQVRPKPALSFAGKYRFIDFNLSNCIHSQVRDIALLVDYKREQLTDYIQQWQNENTSKSNVKMLAPENDGTYTGTANAMYQNLDYLREIAADRILIMPRDHVYKMDYRKMLAFHEKAKADVTVGVVPVPIEEAHRFGTMTLRDDGYVVEYIEKPDVPRSNMVSMGIYIFNKDILIQRLLEDAAEADSLHDFGYSVIPGMVGNDNVYAYKYEGFWRDVGTIDTYYATSLEMASNNPPFTLGGNWPILTCSSNSPIKDISGDNVRNSIVGAGCVIKGRVENSVLSPGVYVDEQAVVKNSILMSNVSVGLHSVVDSCIADENVNIGNFCYVGFGSDRNGMAECTLVGKNAAISSHTAIARGCKIAPDSNPTESLGKVFINDYRTDRQFEKGNQPRIIA